MPVQNQSTPSYNIQNQNQIPSQSPVVKVNIDSKEEYPHKVGVDNKDLNEITKINNSKKIVSRFVEIKKKTIITYEDGSKREIEETENHTFTD